MYKKSNYDRAMQIIQSENLIADTILFDCKLHYCKKVGDSERNKVAYVAYVSKNSIFIWIRIKNKNFMTRYSAINEYRATKEELRSLLHCNMAVADFDEEDEEDNDDDDY